MCKSTVNDHSPLNSQIWPPSPVAIRLASGGSYNSKNVKQKKKNLTNTKRP